MIPDLIVVLLLAVIVWLILAWEPPPAEGRDPCVGPDGGRESDPCTEGSDHVQGHEGEA